MSTTNPNDLLDFNDGQKPALPGSLNVLTILTFIGCALGFIGGIWQYMKADQSYKDIVAAQDKMADAPKWAKRFMGPEMVEMAKKSAENKLPIMLLTLVGVGLCLWGALEMRKLKKQGFMLWVIGEFLPIIGGLIFIGTGMVSGFSMIWLIIPVIFLILYLVQRKYLVY